MLNFDKDMREFQRKFPKQMKSINGVNFHYRLGGDGKITVVLLVGGLGLSDGLYKHALKFAEEYKVLFFDYPYGYDTNVKLVDGIAALIRELNLGRVVLIGQSYGGFLAQLIASRHKSLIDKIVISNSGCLSENLTQRDMEPMNQMFNKLKKIKVLTRIVPMAFLRGKFIRQTMDKIKVDNEDEQQYMEQLITLLFNKLTNKSERHMCTLMIDLMKLNRSKAQDFSYLDGKVLLILSKDDETFSEKVKKELINLMPNPKVCDSLEGGHLALFLKIDPYIALAKKFINEEPSA